MPSSDANAAARTPEDAAGVANRSAKHRKRWIALQSAVAAAGVALSVFAYALAVRANQERIDSLLNFRAEWRSNDLRYKIVEAQDIVVDSAAFIAATPDPTPLAFETFVKAQRQHAGVLRTVLYNVLVKDADRPAFEAVASRMHGRPVSIVHPAGGEGATARWVPAERRGDYLPILLAVELVPVPALTIGIDQFHQPARRAMAMRAASEGRPIATPPVSLVGSAAAGPGFLLYAPVYTDGAPPATAEERQARLRGFVLGTYLIEPTLQGAIQGTPGIEGLIRVFVASDIGAEGPRQVAVYDPTLGRFRHAMDGSMPPPPAAQRVIRSFETYGQRWTLVFDFPPSVTEALGLEPRTQWLWLGGGLLTTALILLIVNLEMRQTERAERAVARGVQSLREENEARRSAEAQLTQSQKMEAVGQLTGGLAHDFNNLLGVVVGNLDLAAERLKDDPKTRELLDAALNGALRGADLVRKLLAFSRRQPLEPRIVDLNAGLPEMVALLKRTLGERVTITAKPTAGLWPVLADPTQVESAILNLAVNARDAMPGGGRLTIETANAHLDSEYVARNPSAVAGDYAMIAVGDDGTGMPPEVAEKAFEPFFTTKPTGKGTGLGLSMVHGFVKQSGGHVKIYSEVGHGTVVKIYLPRATAQAAERPAPAGAAEAVPRGTESILLVEDNPGVREMAERQLAALGYRVLAVENAAAALAEFEGGAAPDLLFTDVVMPGGTSGFDLAAEARRRRPGLKVLFTSGYIDVSTMKVANGRAGPVLRKPYRRPEMAQMVRRVLDGKEGG